MGTRRFLHVRATAEVHLWMGATPPPPSYKPFPFNTLGISLPRHRATFVLKIALAFVVA